MSAPRRCTSAKQSWPRAVTKVAGCVINSGNANACTGAQGMSRRQRDGHAITQLATRHRRSLPRLLHWTDRSATTNEEHHGRHRQPPRQKLDSETQSSLDAADAILTSDTRRKVATARFEYEGTTITVSGMAKGAGMIEPNMATMLAFVTPLTSKPTATCSNPSSSKPATSLSIASRSTAT